MVLKKLLNKGGGSMKHGTRGNQAEHSLEDLLVLSSLLLLGGKEKLEALGDLEGPDDDGEGEDDEGLGGGEALFLFRQEGLKEDGRELLAIKGEGAGLDGGEGKEEAGAQGGDGKGLILIEEGKELLGNAQLVL
jgi:hypothetical protein